MAKEVNLLSYWMPVLRQIKELKEIAKAEEPELVYLLEACDRALNNMFITLADEYGIERFERMMGIFPDENEDLETRRFNVLIKWNDKAPYTEKELFNRLLSLCGSEDNFTIDPQYNDYTINISTELGIKGAFDAVTRLLQDMLPCNLVLILNNYLRESKETPLYGWVTLSTAMVYQITNDINSTVAKETALTNAVANSVAFTGVITHDVGLNDSLMAPVNGAIGVGTAHTTIITHDISKRAGNSGNYTVGAPVSTATVVTIKS